MVLYRIEVVPFSSFAKPRLRVHKLSPGDDQANQFEEPGYPTMVLYRSQISWVINGINRKIITFLQFHEHLPHTYCEGAICELDMTSVL